MYIPEIGEEVVIRDWDDMKEEFGYNADGSSIMCAAVFIEEMRPLCGQHFIVTGVTPVATYSKILGASELQQRLDLPRFTISSDMIRPVDENEEEVDTNEVDSFLKGWKVSE